MSVPGGEPRRYCPSCGGEFIWTVFPAMEAGSARGTAAEPVVVEGQACCFYHERKKAVAACDFCGRFLCALCDLDWGGRRVCPSCLENRRESPAGENLASPLTDKVVRHDSIALAAVAAGLVASIPFWIIGFLLWPAILIVLLFLMRSSRKKARSLVASRGSVRLKWSVALTVAVLASAGSILLAISIFSEILKHL